MTKIEYIKKYGKTILADKLASNDWPNDTKITIVSGQNSPDDKRSNLYKALKSSNLGKYEVGAKLRYASQGSFYAVA